MTSTTKKVRASELTVGQQIAGVVISSVSTSWVLGMSGSAPAGQVTVHFEQSADADAPVLAVFGMSEWVSIDRAAV